MHSTQYLARERTRSHLEMAEQLRSARMLLGLSRAKRLEQRAERRLIEAWQRSAQIQRSLEMQ